MASAFLPPRDFFTKWKRRLSIGAAFFSLAGGCVAQELALDRNLNEEVVMVPGAANAVRLETTIFKPPGKGPFPLVVMNHGKEPGNPHNQKRDRFVVLSKEFLKRGYAVVVPMRTGFSRSTGDYADVGCNMAGNGQLQANDLQSVLDYLRTQAWADSERVIVAGQSYGGLTAMAFGTRNYPGVKGLINFAGGLRADGGTCEWRQSLVQAFAQYGESADLPSLWFYGENDSYFGHELAQRLHDAYVEAGGEAKLVAYGPFKADAHGMIGSRDGVKIWWPETEKFLQQLGLPTDQVVALQEDPPIPPSHYAAIDNLDAIPYLKDKGREAYRTFLGKSLPRAFAVSPDGGWSWAEEGDDPIERVLANCQGDSQQPCQLYAVDDYVVWDSKQPVQMQANALSSAESSSGSQ